MRGALLFLALAACSRAPVEDAPSPPWKSPAEPAWGALPQSDAVALSLAAREATPRTKMRGFAISQLEGLRADASLMVAGEDAIASAYDGWIERDATKPAYVIFGTMHDSRAEVEEVASIAFRMKSIWGLALEQYRAAGRWTGAPKIESADDADLAALAAGPSLDRGALARLAQRQMRFDHAAWKFDYLDAMNRIDLASRGAGVPLVGCDMPPELRTSLEIGGDGERAMRELHCARALRSFALGAAAAHAPDGGLSEDDPPPPEHFAVLVGARHAEPDGLPRFLEKDARVALVRVLGGRPRESAGEEEELAPRLVVTDVVLVRGHGPDALLLPDDTWGGAVDRSSVRGDPQPPDAKGLPRPNVAVSSDAPARFAITDSSIDVGGKPEWLAARAGRQAYVLVAESRTFVGAVDVPESGWAELHFAPKDRALRVVLHAP